MTIISATEARTKLYRLLDEVHTTHDPVYITGKRHSGVLLSEEDWNSIQETMHLVSIPGMKKSIIDGMKTPVNKCAKGINW